MQGGAGSALDARSDAARDDNADDLIVDQVDDGGHDGHGPEGQIRRDSA